MFKFKQYCALSLMAAAVISLSACNDESAKPVAAAQAASDSPAATAAAKVTEKSSFEEKTAYAIGASVGGYISQIVSEQGEFLGKVDVSLIEQGFKDALAGNSSLTPKQIEETLQALDQKVQEQMAQKMQQEAQQNLEQGQKFLAENAKKEGVVTTKSGLQYKVVKEGKGKKPAASDTIKVKYKGTTIDGQVFDEQTEPVSFPLQNMIAGWVEGLQLMQEGAVYELYIPANLAYGENGAGNLIKPNSALIFNVELVEVVPQPEDKQAGGAAGQAASSK